MTDAQRLAQALNPLTKTPQFSYTKARAAARNEPAVNWPATKARNEDFNAEVDGCDRSSWQTEASANGSPVSTVTSPVRRAAS